jgi:hypothetical protein
MRSCCVICYSMMVALKQRESKKELEELFQSLMQRAYRGELAPPSGGINSESVDEGEECVNRTPLNPTFVPPQNGGMQKTQKGGMSRFERDRRVRAP